MDELISDVCLKSYQTVSRETTFEIFKLDEIDLRVFFWLVDNERLRHSLTSWLEFICIDYKRRRGISINIARLLEEARLLETSRDNSQGQ